MIVDAVAFKADWERSFETEATITDRFWRTPKDANDVRMMQQDGEFDLRRGDGFRLMRLPYKGDAAATQTGPDRGFEMVILLPSHDKPLPDAATFVRELAGDASWELTELEVKLPKFSFDNEHDLVPALRRCGLTRPFQRSHNDFSHLVRSPLPVWIDRVLQQSFIEVSEEGTEAVAATCTDYLELGIDDEDDLQHEPFHVNHPCRFAIRHSETKLILFQGCLASPPIA